MLDLKAKLASAGLVSEDDLKRAEQQKQQKRSRKPSGGPKHGKPTHPGKRSPKLDAKRLKGEPKAKVYDAVRRWVESARLDAAGGIPSERVTTYHFAQMNGRIGKLSLEPEIVKQLEQGSAGLVAFMSHHGLAHAVVPADGARDLATIYPLWLRVLVGDERAGQVDKG